MKRFGLLGRQGGVEVGERGCPWEFWRDVVGSPLEGALVSAIGDPQCPGPGREDWERELEVRPRA